jgi:hypothetical protein
MRRRNAIMAVLSIIFLFVLLIAMVLAVSSGLGSVGFFVIGGFSYALLVGLVILAVPIIIFVMITIILLTAEASQATRRGRRHGWLRPKSTDATAVYVEEPAEGRH